MTCRSLNWTSSFSVRGKMPGSVQAVRSRKLMTKIKSTAPIMGTATDNFRYKYGQLVKIKIIGSITQFYKLALSLELNLLENEE